MTPHQPSESLSAAGRLSALADTGLTATPDPALDRFTAMVRTVLAVPVALVSLVEADRQIFPGACGLGHPWQQQRQTPLSHSFCRHVVVTAAPLIVEDARTDPRTAGNPAIEDLNVVGYAGMPLTDDAGNVLGSLCAIDSAARRWTSRELTVLADLAAACSDMLRLRIATRAARQGEDDLRKRSATADAAFNRTQLLLRASVALADTSTGDDVVGVVRDLVTSSLNPAYVGVSLLDPAGRVTLQSGMSLPASVAERWKRYPGTAATPSALAARIGAPVLLPDLASVRALTPDAADTFTELGWQSAASVPLPGLGGPIGALTFVWRQPCVLDPADQAVLAALAGFVAQALQRADYLFSRENVATVLQRAMLTDLPDTAPYEVAARYEPAARGEHVGGDWYDAVRLDPRQLALVIGDVTGHDMGAAARMGQLRSKLRLLLIDRHEPPAALIRRLDAANRALDDRITATLLLAYLSPDAGGRGHQLRWSNAGHPSPLLITGTGVTALDGRDPMIGVPHLTPRTTHTHALPADATVLFYTDGLIETRRRPFDECERELHAAVATLGHLPLPELLDTLYQRFAGNDHEDDVALMAVRPHGDQPRISQLRRA
ncbi:GAF domain-containing SpoIIE family protein phosphatase [Actinoplanes sp. NPDC049265]|uniref:GAF domain-containing SpoIIE family protein phosphatase n=1 Tax=Actinoplanes sp. NPDC049265 TaxID=3363902 RepID=UPI00370FBD97